MSAFTTVTPARVVRATAPVRVCDVGGWTDTWFAGHGRVCNIAVQPGVEVVVTVWPRAARRHAVVVDAVDYGERLVLDGEVPARHRLLAAAVEEAVVPEDCAVEISIASGVPPGCATGTSAAVGVAVIGAVDRLAPAPRPPAEIAAAAHRAEVERLGLQSGVQDQLAAAHGGINHIEITDYPNARVQPVTLTREHRDDLERRLVLVYLGRAHHSSPVHDRVAAELAGEGLGSPRLEALRHDARRAAEALARGDWAALGQVMVDSTEHQTALHPSLVCDEAHRIIALARAHGASGWKVNGAGGDGGSLTLLCDGDVRQRDLLRAVDASGYASVIPIRLSDDGLVCRDL
jgi:D-glycero-alpha-D-manno-heptose-7-phosphate kinase